LIKNSQPFGKKFQKTVGGIFFDSHCTSIEQSCICDISGKFVRIILAVDAR